VFLSRLHAHIMTTGVRRRVDDQAFDIHEDVRTEETEVIEEMEDEDMGERRDDDDDLDDEDERATTNTQANRDMSKAAHTTEVRELAGDYDEYDEEEEEEEDDDEQEEPDFDASDNERVDSQTQSDMDKLESDFPGFRQSYRLIKRIGEGKTLL
jgi:cell division control protein 7